MIELIFKFAGPKFNNLPYYDTDHKGFNLWSAILLLKSSLTHFILLSLMSTVFFTSLFLSFCPKYEAKLTLTPGYIKYVTASGVVKDRFYSGRDLQILIQHDMRNHKETTDVKIGNLEVLAHTSDLLHITFYGDEEKQIRDFVTEFKEKYSVLPTEKVELFNKIKSDQSLPNIVVDLKSAKSFMIEIVKTMPFEDVVLSSSHYFSVKFISILIVFSLLLGLFFSSFCIIGYKIYRELK